MVPVFDQSYLRKVTRFEFRMRNKSPKDWVELCTLYLEVNKGGSKFEFWKEKGVKSKQFFMLPSTQVREQDLLKARNKVIDKGKLLACEVSFYEEDFELAKEVAIETIDTTLESHKRDLEILYKQLKTVNFKYDAWNSN